MMIPNEHRTEKSGWYYRSRGKRWRGPYYLRTVTRTGDLLALVDELLAIVRTNAPLTAGLEAAAAECRRGRRSLPPITSFWKYLLTIAVIVLLAALYIGAFVELIVDAFGDEYLRIIIGFTFICVLVARLRTHMLKRHRMEAIYLTLRDKLNEGTAFHDAMGSLRNLVPAHVLNLVRAGEEAGRLHDTLLGVRDRILARQMVRLRITRTLLYGLTLATLTVIITAFLSVKVLPVFWEIAEEFGFSIPDRTRALMDLVSFFTYHWPDTLIIALLPAAIIMVLFALVLRMRSRQLLSLPLFYVPLLRRPLLQAHFAPVCEMLAMLLDSGVPLPTALKDLEDMPLHPYTRWTLRWMRRRIEQGESFTDATRAQRERLPHSFAPMIALAESAHMIPQSLALLGDTYGRATQARAEIIAQLALPAVVVLVGSMVLFVQMATFESIWNLADAIVFTL